MAELLRAWGEVLDGTASDETRARVGAEMENPQGRLRQFVDELKSVNSQLETRETPEQKREQT